ncbi:MAG TPA: CDP-diacylglycerol--glycerol-3-phosphate 3-phosphatidyltransferase [Kiritimatiellia bacterium]|nr:CDP-diacylglycerol--glycerol-3-phosphate 3-phosphatidyltransferase [Kiritimatiellia bacterium]HRZ10866.1 CDP-diacylglycerol--glycerol-3-phosphate 3-phosphatidyltransferase [Kiritimatiellia bacterium]HSA18861.1 CDP-diacylglycerol--glycerol-3-phosphate 3-phosphatidyltransferase [Kiritimatiellia bacterium]
MNLPNILTMSRLALAAVMMAFLSLEFPYSRTLALLVFSAAAITDYFDGYLARRHYGITAFGQLMDPLTDKVLVCAAFVSFVEMQLVPAWIAVIIIGREFLVTGLRLLAAHRGVVVSAGRWGKHKTVWQITAIVIVLLGLAVRQDYLAWAAPRILAGFDLWFARFAYAISLAVAGITLVSGGLYFREHRDIIDAR